jgi:hypothetical protein
LVQGLLGCLLRALGPSVAVGVECGLAVRWDIDRLDDMSGGTQARIVADGHVHITNRVY